jgi:hypothetical protein
MIHNSKAEPKRRGSLDIQKKRYEEKKISSHFTFNSMASSNMDSTPIPPPYTFNLINLIIPESHMPILQHLLNSPSKPEN